MKPKPNSRPILALGCRLNEKQQQPRVLHMPERALKLNGPSLEIIERCDGKRTVRDIVLELQRVYSKTAPLTVEQEILEYLELLHDRRALDFASVDGDEGTEEH